MSFIGDDIGKVVQAVRTGSLNSRKEWIPGAFDAYDEKTVTIDPYFMFGHRLEISNRLSAKDNDKVKKKQKYPLIALGLDIIETVRGVVTDYSVNLIIATYTDRNLNAEERSAQVLKPVLEPLYDKFFQAFKDSGLFMWDSKNSQDLPPHSKIFRPYWGTAGTEANVKNIFNDPIDAIEITNMKFSQIQKNC